MARVAARHFGRRLGGLLGVGAAVLVLAPRPALARFERVRALKRAGLLALGGVRRVAGLWAFLLRCALSRLRLLAADAAASRDVEEVVRRRVGPEKAVISQQRREFAVPRREEPLQKPRRLREHRRARRLRRVRVAPWGIGVAERHVGWFPLEPDEGGDLLEVLAVLESDDEQRVATEGAEPRLEEGGVAPRREAPAPVPPEVEPIQSARLDRAERLGVFEQYVVKHARSAADGKRATLVLCGDVPVDAQPERARVGRGFDVEVPRRLLGVVFSVVSLVIVWDVMTPRLGSLVRRRRRRLWRFLVLAARDAARREEPVVRVRALPGLGERHDEFRVGDHRS
mmetsp:Transcript_25865/g.103360  ORF Transcript_25865/g.103360 Transcript_25865/m.103360 type:complete len:341 (+) Transcript_25865:2463-3485(+)